MSELLKPLQQTANLLGMAFLPPFVHHGAALKAPAEAIAQSAQRYAAYVRRDDLDPARRLARMLEQMQAEGTSLAPA